MNYIIIRKVHHHRWLQKMFGWLFPAVFKIWTKYKQRFRKRNKQETNKKTLSDKIDILKQNVLKPETENLEQIK